MHHVKKHYILINKKHVLNRHLIYFNTYLNIRVVFQTFQIHVKPMLINKKAYVAHFAK